MPKKPQQPQSRRHIFIYDEDWEWLEGAYGQSSPNKLGTGIAIRALVHKFVLAQRAKTQQLLDARPSPSGDDEI